MEEKENSSIDNPVGRKQSTTKQTFARDKQCDIVVKNVHKLLCDLKTDLKSYRAHYILSKYNLENINNKTAELCHVSKSFVKKVIKQDQQIIQAHRSDQSSRFKYKCDEFTISMIRRITQDFYHQKKYPTSAKIHAVCLQNKHFPPVGLTTFKKWLKYHCKFKYRKINKKPVYLERRDIICQRERYLRSIKNYRENGYKIFYSDETWASPDQARSRCWQMLLNDDEHKVLVDKFSGPVLRDMDGWTGGFMLKSAAGRVIINHIGNEDGFLKGAEDIFICKKDTKDYHGNMNYERYEVWFKNVLKLIPEKSVIVVDQAPYHKKRVEGTVMPTIAWLKQRIINWLELHNVELPADVSSFAKLTKASLISLSKTKPVKTKYCIEMMAEESGKDLKVLWLPPAHCEFNPIELIWAKVKGYVAEHNKGNNIAGIMDLSKEGIREVTPELWKRCVLHAMKYEETMWERDNLMDHLPFENTPEPVIVPVNDDDDTSESESSDSDSELD